MSWCAICDLFMRIVWGGCFCHGSNDAVDSVDWLLKLVLFRLALEIAFDDGCKTTVFVVPSAELVVNNGGNLICTGTVVLSLVGTYKFYLKLKL